LNLLLFKMAVDPENQSEEYRYQPLTVEMPEKAPVFKNNYERLYFTFKNSLFAIFPSYLHSLLPRTNGAYDEPPPRKILKTAFLDGLRG
jgi:hypothetical protein